MKKILFVQWNAFMQKGMESALRRLRDKFNIEYENFFYDFKDWDNDNVFCRLFEKKLTGGKTADKAAGVTLQEEKAIGYDAVLTVNFSPLISDVCEKYNVRYISWV